VTNSICLPSTPPLALVSPRQISIASSADLPFAASGPVCAMPKPMRIGSAAHDGRGSSGAAATPRTVAANERRSMISSLSGAMPKL